MRTSTEVNENKIMGHLKWFCAGATAIVPGYTFFTTYPPPIFPGISILTSVLAAAIIYITWTYNPRTQASARSLEKLVRLAILWLLLAFVFLTIYVLLIRYCTVFEPQEYEQRFQVGFCKFDWSLTEVGLKLKHKMPLAPLEDWLLTEGAFRSGGPELIWTSWSIATAGSLLVFTYMAGFVLWTVGFSLLAKHKANPSQPNKANAADA